jgi:hypothetical protein
MDAPAEYNSMLASTYSPKKHRGHHAHTSPVPETEIDGIKIPAKLEGVSSLNFVLTQSEGKLKPKDLKKAIAKQRAIREEQLRIQEQLSSKGGADAAGGNVTKLLVDEEKKCMIAGSTRQLRELAFLQEIKDIDLAEKRREFASKDEYIGSDLMSASDIDSVLSTRQAIAYDQGLAKRNNDRSTWSTRATGAFSVPPDRVYYQSDFVPSYSPTFDPYKNDVWKKRSQVILKFIKAASKIIYMRRVTTRLVKVKERLGSSTNRSAVRSLVEMENRLASATGGSKHVLKDSFTVILPSEAIHPITFPEWSESEATVRLPVETATPRKFDDFSLFPLKSLQEYVVVGHQEVQLPAFQYYIPLENDREMRAGAFEEETVRAPRGEDVTIYGTQDSGSDGKAEALNLLAPEWLSQEPHHDCETIILPDTTIRQFSEPLPFEETQADFDLRPRLRMREIDPTFGAVLKDTPGMVGACAMNGGPTISNAWQPRNINSVTPIDFLTRHPLQAPGVIPGFLSGPLPEDQLSDEESDDIGSRHVAQPTPGSPGNKVVVAPSLSDARKEFGASDAQAPDHLDYLSGDREYAALELGRKKKRDENIAKVTATLTKLNESITDPRLKFIPVYNEDRMVTNI